MNRSLPHSEDMERGLLCSMIHDQDALLSCARLNPGIFHIPAHQSIFKVLCALSAHDTPLAFPLVKLALSNAKELEAIGGVEYLNEIFDFVPTGANWQHYRERVCEYHRRRVTIAGCQQLIEQMFDPELEADQSVTEVVESTLTKLSLNAAKPEKTSSANWWPRL